MYSWLCEEKHDPTIKQFYYVNTNEGDEGELFERKHDIFTCEKITIAVAT